MLDRKFIASILLITFPLMVSAADLGVFGQTYPILEMDFLEYIQMKLNDMQKNGEMRAVQNRFRENVARHSDRPMPVRNISRSMSNKSWTIDPSITVPYDMKDLNGRIFAKAGTIINPLKYITIHHPMFFIDGDDPAQIQWINQIIKQERQDIKLVLVNGSVSDTVKIIQQPVYFDQEGRLTTKFHIQHVPATVSQQGKHLLIQEMAI